MASGPDSVESSDASDGLVADSLVVTFTAGVGLGDWQRTGVLGREWALYRQVARHFRRIVLVTNCARGEAAREAEIGRGLRIDHAGPQVVVVACEAGTDSAAEAPGRVLEALSGSRNAIIKTNQMLGGDVAVAIRQGLERAGIATGLVVRGGYPWSRFCALEHGPASVQACEAAAREGELCRAADVVVGTTAEMVEDLAWRYELGRERFSIVPNYVNVGVNVGVDEGAIRRGTPRRDGSADGADRMFTILFAGRLEKQKRLDRLIDGVALLPPEMLERTRLLIVGDGSQRQWLGERAAESGVRAVFEPRMPHEALLAQMAACDVYAQVSDYEGHPKTVLEAMAMGAPVLVCDTPGMCGTVEDGVTGLRIAPRPASVARGLARLLHDRPFAKMLGQAASAQTRERFSIQRIAALEVEVYRRAAGRAMMRQAHGASSAVAEGVRFEPALLNAEVEQAVTAWVRPLRGFARRLPAQKRAQFVMALDTPLYHLQGETAVEADGGLHPKHRLMRYHDFFADRIGRGERVIDLGCGVGALAASIAERCEAAVVGVDLSEPTLEQARSRVAERGLAARIEYIQGDITALRVPGRFDVVVLSNVLEHITDRPERLRMWREWYGDPRFLIRVPAFDREWRVPWKKELGVEWRLDPTHETEYTQAQLEQELQQAGLQMRECIVRWGEYYTVARAG